MYSMYSMYRCQHLFMEQRETFFGFVVFFRWFLTCFTGRHFDVPFSCVVNERARRWEITLNQIRKSLELPCDFTENVVCF